MNRFLRFSLCIGIGMALTGPLSAAEEQKKGLIKNGEFELDEDGNGIPDGWDKPEINGNLIKNSGFEENYPDILQPNYWQFQAWGVDAAGAVDENCVRSGDKALKIRIPCINETNNMTALYFQVVPVKPNTEYDFSGWMKNTAYLLKRGSAGCYIAVTGKDRKKVFAQLGHRVAQGSKWTKFSTTFRTTKETKEVLVLCAVADVAGDTWFDDISLEQINERKNQ